MKVLDKKIGDIEYIKYRVNLPKKIVEQSNLLNKELKIKSENNKIIIEKDTKQNIELELTTKEKMLQRDLIKLVEKNKK